MYHFKELKTNKDRIKECKPEKKINTERVLKVGKKDEIKKEIIPYAQASSQFFPSLTRSCT